MVASRADAAMDAEALFAALPPPTCTTIARLRAKGVSPDALCEPEVPAQARVTFGLQTFDFADGDGGMPALVFVALDERGEPADLVAWSPAERRCAPHWGAACLLGAESLLAPRLTNQNALPVYRDPLGWLLGGRFGVVPIDLQSAALKLREFGPFRAEDERHGIELRRLFRQTEPQIFVPKPDRVRRAA